MGFLYGQRPFPLEITRHRVARKGPRCHRIVDSRYALRRGIEVAGKWFVTRSIPMLDVIMLAIGLGFFALSVGYAYTCDRL